MNPATRLSTFNAVSLALGLAFLYLPIVILVIYSFNASRLVTVWGGWSLRWYGEFFHDRAMLEAAWMSFRVPRHPRPSRRCSARWPRWRCRAARGFGDERCFPACSMRRW